MNSGLTGISFVNGGFSIAMFHRDLRQKLLLYWSLIRPEISRLGIGI